MLEEGDDVLGKDFGVGVGGVLYAFDDPILQKRRVFFGEEHGEGGLEGRIEFGARGKWTRGEKRDQAEFEILKQWGVEAMGGE